MQLQPVVRLILTAVAAGIGAVVATLDGQPEWLQAVLAGAAATLAAVGIIPPQVPTKTVASKRQEGYSIVELLFALILLLILVVVLFKVLDRI